MLQRTLFAAFCLFLTTAAPVAAEETRLVIRALASDAKFIGTSMSGMEVLVRDADTGEILDRGVTRGATGDTTHILRTAHERYSTLSTEGAAAYTAVLDLDRPRRISVTVRGPLSQPQAGGEASSTRWVLPGKHIEEGDGWLLEVSGFAVDILEPGAHTYVGDDVDAVKITTNVVMMCGCPTSPGGTWDSDEIEMDIQVLRNGKPVSVPPMQYAGELSLYTTDIKISGPGAYEVTVTAYDPRTGNTGLDRTSFVVR